VLVALDEDGSYQGGVGVKPHTEYGVELAVGTDEARRGRGLARRLVAQAARSVLASGRLPLYVHAPDNIPSARVADAAGFPDRGWRLLVAWEGRHA
jgi:predicted GNAT family acetyltransferase